MFDPSKPYLGTLVRPVAIHWSLRRQARIASWLLSAAIAAVGFLPARLPWLP